MRSTQLAIAVASVASLLALTACGGDPEVDTTPAPSPTVTVAETPAMTPEPAPSPSPSPSPVFDAHPPLEDLVVTTSGVLPLAIGVPLDSNPGAEMLFLEEDSCYSEELGITDGDLDRWIADYSMGTHPDGFEMRPFGVDVAPDGTLWRIDIFGSALYTPEGIGVGAPLTQLQAAYPDLTAGSSGEISEVWWIEGAEGYVVFETQDNSDGLLPGATEPEVILMRVIMADADPDFAAANSGDVAGACF